MSFVVGGAYAVSAGLIVYAIDQGFITRSEGFRYLVGWAVAGLVLAAVAVVKRQGEK